MAPAAAPGAQLAGKGIAAEAEAGSGFGAATVGDLQRCLQQGMVDPLAHLRVQPFHALGQLTKTDTLKLLKKDIARLQTIQRQRAVKAEG